MEYNLLSPFKISQGADTKIYTQRDLGVDYVMIQALRAPIVGPDLNSESGQTPPYSDGGGNGYRFVDE